MTADLARREREDRAIARATRILERRAPHAAGTVTTRPGAIRA